MSILPPNNLKRAIVACLTEHPEAEAYRQAAFVENPAQLAEEMARKQVLTKADFLAADDQGKAFLDSAGGWKNFEKIVQLVQSGGENFTYDDFMSPVTPDAKRTLLESAAANSSTAKVFSFELWKGRFTEMEKLWYMRQDRLKSEDKLVPMALKRQLLEAEGKIAPEDRLAKAHMTMTDIRSAVASDYDFNKINRQLEQAGDYFRKDYVLTPDSYGDYIFDRIGSFARFDAVLKAMQEHGECFEVGDYLRQLSTRPSLLERAANENALNKIFTPAQWVDRLPGMLDLWSNVKDGWKRAPMSPQDFDRAYAEAEGLTYARRSLAREFNDKAALLTPLNPGGSEKPVLPLGLKAVWEKFDVIKGKLAEKGEALTTADLRAPSGQMGDTCLISAAKFDCFDKVVGIAKQSSQPLTLDDFLTKDAHGNTLINILAEKKQLSQVFTVDAWAGQLADMRALWSHVSAAQRRQINFLHLEVGVKQAGLKKKAASGGFKLNPQ